MAKRTISMGRISSNHSHQPQNPESSNQEDRFEVRKEHIKRQSAGFIEETDENNTKNDENTKDSPQNRAENPTLILLQSELKRGILTENPVLRLVLGTCPTLAITTAASNALGMGMAATLVLICSNTVISLMRDIIPDKVRIPAYITIIASFVSVVQMLVKAFAPALDESLGIYLPLIVVNCIILGRAEMYASKHAPLKSALDGLVMGIGFTAALLCMGIIRELLGAGSIFGVQMGILKPILFFSLAPGGFFVFGLLIAAANRLSRENDLPVRTGCGDCPAADTCSMSDKGGHRR